MYAETKPCVDHSMMIYYDLFFFFFSLLGKMSKRPTMTCLAEKNEIK